MPNFQIIDFPQEGKRHGNYSANSPGQAASKAFSALIKKMQYDRDDSEKFIIFTIKSDKNGKLYEYVGTRIKLHKPILIGDRVYKHRNIVVSHKDNYFY